MIKNDTKRRKKDTKVLRERKSSFNSLLPDTNGRNRSVCHKIFLNMRGHCVFQTISMKSDGNISPSAISTYPPFCLSKLVGFARGLSSERQGEFL